MLRAVLLLLAALPAARASPARPRGSRHLHELEASGHGIDSGRRLHAATPCENSIEPLLSGMEILTRVQVAKLIHRIRKELAKLPDEI